MPNEPTTRGRVFEATLGLLKSAKKPPSMAEIATAAGLSRQALYFLFKDRADLFVGLLRYVDGKRGLVEELAKIRDAPSGIDALHALIDMQARLNPGYRELVDTFEVLRRQDPAAEEAWKDRLFHRREGCRAIIDRFDYEGRLRKNIQRDEAIDLLWTMTSVTAWNDLVIRRGWSKERYKEELLSMIESAICMP